MDRTGRRMARLGQRLAMVRAANAASAQPCPDPEAHKLHTYYLGEFCSVCGGDSPSQTCCGVIELELGTDGVWAVPDGKLPLLQHRPAPAR